MSAFDVGWLRLREPHDAAARAAASAAFDLPGWAVAARSGGAALEVLELGCGRGANLRELAPRLGGPQRWRLVDHDAALLAALPEALADWAAAGGHQLVPAPGGLRLVGHDAAGRRFEAEVGWQRLDLAAGLERLPFDAVQLVTASALTDLVSAAWLQALAERAAAQRCALLLALAVDGRVAWTPTDPDDAAVHAAFAAHQRRDKGFGPALGPQAPVEAATRLAALGYRVVTAPSDWQIDGACDPVMVAAMIDGHAAAATEQQPAAAGCIAAWRARRHAAVGTTLLRVGHVDLFATPPAAP